MSIKNEETQCSIPVEISDSKDELSTIELIFDKLLYEADPALYLMIQVQKQRKLDINDNEVQDNEDQIIHQEDDSVPGTNINDDDQSQCQGQENPRQLLNDTFDDSAKQPTAAQSIYLLSLSNSTLSTKDGSNIIPGDEDNEKEEIESDNKSEVKLGKDFSPLKPPMEPSEKEHINKEQLVKDQPEINLKKAIQPYQCSCGNVYKTASVIKNHVERMKKKGEKLHATIPRNIKQGRPMKLSKKDKKIILKIWKKEPLDKKNNPSVVGDILQKFQDKINNAYNFFLLDKPMIQQLGIDKMKLREFFFSLSIYDADSFIDAYFDYKLQSSQRSYKKKSQLLLSVSIQQEDCSVDVESTQNTLICSSLQARDSQLNPNLISKPPMREEKIIKASLN